MSVRKPDRQQGQLPVLDLARRLLVHTITVCKNEGAFPKSQRWIFTRRLVDEAMDAYACIREANSALLREGPTLEVDYAYRRSRQVEAHGHIVALLGLIDIADELGTVGDRTEHWAGLASQTNDACKAWMRSDKKRYLSMRAPSRD